MKAWTLRKRLWRRAAEVELFQRLVGLGLCLWLGACGMREFPEPAPKIYRQVRHCVAGFCNVGFAYENRFAMREDCEAIARVEAAALEQRFPVY